MKTPQTIVSLPGIAKWIAAVCAAWWIRTPSAVQALCWLLMIDYATGFLLACYERRVSSEVGWWGLVRKLMKLLLLLAVYHLELSTHVPWDLVSPVASAFCFNEMISIVENAANFGVWIPKPLLDVLVQARRITGTEKPKARGAAGGK